LRRKHKDTLVDRAIRLVRARQIAEAHQELMHDQTAGEAKRAAEQARPFVERSRG
jgi:hypothetical protein